MLLSMTSLFNVDASVFGNSIIIDIDAQTRPLRDSQLAIRNVSNLKRLINKLEEIGSAIREPFLDDEVGYACIELD